MRIKYKGSNQFLFRRFWRVASFAKEADGSFTATNKAGKKLFVPAGMVVITIGQITED